MLDFSGLSYPADDAGSCSWFGLSLNTENEADDAGLEVLIDDVVSPDSNTCGNSFDYVADTIGEKTMAEGETSDDDVSDSPKPREIGPLF